MKFAFRQGNGREPSRYEQAVRFYKEVFGLQIAQEDEKWVELFAGNCRLTLYKGDPSELVLESDPILEGFTPFEAGSLEECSGRWRRDPFGLAFRWRLLREHNIENSCYL